jgi:transcriptional regulator with XRE-family HTH domain
MKRRHRDFPEVRTMSTTVKQLVAYMEASHLTLRDISRKSGVSTATIYRWFTGEGEPRVIDLEAVAVVVKATIVVEPVE